MTKTKIKLYQIRRDLDNRGDLYCNNLAYLQRIINFRRDLNQYYKEVYDFEDDFTGMTDDEILDTIYNRFTMNIPDDFNGNRMSISDIVVIDDKMFFKDSYGFQEI